MGGTNVYASNFWLPVAASIFLAVLSLYSWRRRRVPAALPLSAGALFAALWLLGIAFAATAVAPATKIAWHKFQAAWHLPSATVMLCFALEYVYPGRWLTRRTLILLALPPLLVMLLIGMNGGQLMWGRLEVAPDGTIVRSFTAAGTILMIYGLCLALVNVAAYVWLFIRSPQHRQPIALMLAGDIAARSVYGLYQLDSGVRSLSLHDAFVIGLLLDWSMYAFALFGFRIFDPLPAARAAALAQMPEGMAVFDAQWRVVSLNPAAATMLSISAGHARHKFLAEVLPGYCDEVARCPDQDPAPAEISLKTRNGVRQIALDFTVLQDFRGLTIGRLLMLRDVTEWRHEQARAMEHQRTLAVIHERERMARELHDNLGQVLAYVTTEGQTVRRLLARGDIAQADDQVERLVEVAGEANTDVRESILGLQATFDAPGLLPTLATYLDRYEKHYGIHTTLNAPPSLASDFFEPLAEVHVLRIVQEALTNARKHAQASSVCVTLALADGHAQVTVQDDGCGFDLQAVAGSSGGVGLRVMRERAEEIGGMVAVKSVAGAGTQVVLTVPLQAASG